MKIFRPESPWKRFQNEMEAALVGPPDSPEVARQSTSRAQPPRMPGGESLPLPELEAMDAKPNEPTTAPLAPAERGVG